MIEAGTEDLAGRAAELRRRILTGSMTLITGSVSEILREFGLETLDVGTAVAVTHALSAAGLTSRPEFSATLTPETRVVIKIGSRDTPGPSPSSPEAAGGGLAAAVKVSTTFGVPGYEVVAFHGEVFGLVVRSRNLVANYGASAKAIIGGELKGLTKLLIDGRNEALVRMRGEALALGANAVVGLRYDTAEIGASANEVVAYGTAVTIRAASTGPPDDTAVG
jgi:uncharacterized protein YbjQ (UPF0145 family)